MKRVLLLCSLLSASAVGLGNAGARHAHRNAMCPSAVPGTSISVADTKVGIAVTFTTSEPAKVAELRQRVSAMEQMHERHLIRGTEEPAGERPRRMAMHVIPGSATVEDVPDGARVVFEPEDAENLDDLRTHVQVMVQTMRERGPRMAAGEECPMMEMMKGPEALQEDEEEGRPR